MAEVREKGHEFRKQIRDGINPIAERQTKRTQAKLQKEKIKTFQECALAYIEAHQAGWKNEKHRKQRASTLEKYTFPVIGNIPVADIETTLVYQFFLTGRGKPPHTRVKLSSTLWLINEKIKLRLLINVGTYWKIAAI